MEKKSNISLFRKLTKLFRSGPVVKRKVRSMNVADGGVSTAFETFRKSQSQVYSAAMSAYGTYDRLARYSDFSEMEYTPEISSALDIYAEETVSADERGTVLTIYSENATIKKILEELFYDTINVEFNLTAWVRNLCKYGDFFLFNDVSQEHGIVNAFPIPVSEMEREEGFDPKDPMAVRFRWVTQGNQVLENWQVCHMRILGNDAFLPYGSSVLESARRIWRQLILVEDAMLVYRIVRSPERRVFYIDVGNVPPEDIPNYMEQAQASLKKASVVDKTTGRVDLRYNPLSVDEDYYIPRRGGETGTEVSTLAGGANATAIEDVEYIQKKLFAALKIPKAYLGYDEGLGAKATLSQEDIRFSRSINRIQRTVIAELNKIAIIHLYCNGFEGEDLLDFNLQLANPSTIAVQQKLELFRSRFEIAGTAATAEGMVDRNWIRKNILGLTDEEIDRIIEGKFEDKKYDLELESVSLEGDEGMDVAAEDDFGDMEMAADDRNEKGLPMLSEKDSEDFSSFDLKSLSIVDDNAPIKAMNAVNSTSGILESDTEYEKERKKKHNRDKENRERKLKRKRGADEVDHLSLVSHGDKSNTSDSLIHPDGMKDEMYKLRSANKISNALSERDYFDVTGYLDNKLDQNARMDGEMKSVIRSLERYTESKPRVISEKKVNSSEEE